MATMYAGDRTDVELDFETLALLKLFREKKLEKTWLPVLKSTLTQQANEELAQLFVYRNCMKT